MDLRPIAAPPSDAERAAIDAVLDPPDEDRSVGLKDARDRRHLLLPALHAAQARAGWVSPGALGYVCERLHVPPAEGYGVASFYALFSLSPRAPTVVHVCDDIACQARGAAALCADLERRIGPPGARPHGPSTTPAGAADTRSPASATTWLRSPCLGLCERAPAALLVAAGAVPVERALGPASAAAIERLLATDAPPEAPSETATSQAVGRAPAPAPPPATALPKAGDPALRLLRRVGRADPTSLDDYRAHGGYQALRRALDLGPAGTLREVSDARLVGRGGAAFPTARKWEAVARAPVRPHHLVCNADESEPGTFKDRVLMEEDPFAVVEAMTVAALATGCARGYLYVRGEYPLAAARLAAAIAQSRARGLLGADVMGRGLRFDVELRRGAGAYICGEETALFNSLEGFRGEPRNKPPFPVEVGLFGKPTCVNNVETLVAALEILSGGAAAWAAAGTPGSTGTKLFCLSGHVEKPGLYEVPLGTRLDHLLALAGGVSGGRPLGAVLLGGAAGAFVRPDELATPLSFEGVRAIGATLGSGVVLVLDEATPVLPLLRRIAAFFRDESCGQCVPCRVGTVRQEELLARLAEGQPLGSLAGERHLLAELGQAMRDASICGLGQTASSAIESAFAKLPLFREAP